MPTQKKVDAVKILKDKIENSKSVIFVDYKGLSVSEDTNLRRKMRESKVEYIVAKNRLFKIALKEAGIEESFDDILKGTTSFAFGVEDAVTAAKVVNDFSEEFDKKYNIKAGLLEGKRVDVEEVVQLAKLPPKEILVAKMLAGMQAPMTGLVNVMSGPTRGLACALNAIKEQKEA